MNHPQQLGKYQITDVIGEGAMGVVYKGFDPDIRRTVALKTIRRQLDDGSNLAAGIAARFRNEAQAAGRLSHPGIVAVYDFGEDSNVAFIAMEYVRGQSLARYMGSGHRFSDEQIPDLMYQLLDALAHAHQQGVWHRDIKPGNIIMTDAGRLKVADFGIARIDGSGLTQTRATLGTPAYMAPEQFLGTTIDQRVDIYGVGVLLYLMLTGQPVFSGTTESLMYKVVHQDPLPPSSVAGVSRPHFYDALVAKALAKDPQARFESANAFKSALMASMPRGPAETLFEATVFTPVPPRSAGQTHVDQAGRMPLSQPGRKDWDPTTLARAESSLARSVGPLAGLLVRRAALECADVPALYAQLAEHVTDPAARKAFLAQTGAQVSATHVPGGPTHPRSRPGTSPGEPISESLIEQSTRLLAQRIGPIAKVVVKRAAARESRRNLFFVAVAQAVSDEAARDKLLAELARLP